MPGKVIVEVIKGGDEGKTFEFSGQRSFVIGREKGCAIQLSERTVSRCHCGMEIKPPKITFYDAGSKNGTYINGELAAEGRGDMSPEEAAKREHKTLSLKNGDILGIGSDVELAFTVIEPEYCAGCLGEIEEGGNHVNRAGERICAACFEAQKKIDEFATLADKAHEGNARKKQAGPVCSICGAPLGDIKPGQARICGKCQKPDDIIDRIIEQEEQKPAKEIAPVDIRNYRQVKKLGEGGMGVVFLVEEADTGKKAALKYMRPSESVDEHARKLFLREADVGRRLDHPHVIKQFDSGSIGDSFYILMEYCRGGSVDRVMEKTGTIPEAMAVDITLQVLDGLIYTHSLGIIHRDIKPFNFFIANDFKPESFYKPDSGSGKMAFHAGSYLGADSSRRPVVKVADFGLAKAFDSAVLSRTGETKGTLSFAPRQQIIDSKHVANEVDTWAAAASLYYILSGRTPKPVRNRLTMFDDLLNNPAIPIRAVNPFVSEKLAKVIDKALGDNPIVIQEAADLKAAIQEVL